jgi:peptidoglycan/LPS O-acetylase OafA/YrhL
VTDSVTATAESRERALFHGARRFPALDGLRAVSILMVITWHMGDDEWSTFNGSLGVALFFVISGFLITTLLLREEHRNGRISLSKFMIRRVFRILPLYYLALALTTVLVLGFGLGDQLGNFVERLPLLATFNGEFAGSGTFSLSWSLGIEEKFYIVWPILAFAVTFIRNRRALLISLLVPLSIAASFTPGFGYIGIFAPILCGCALALLMHSKRLFGVAYVLAQPVVASALALATLAFGFFSLPEFLQDESRYGHAAFGVVATLALPGFLIRNSPLRRALSSDFVVRYGQHAYGIYLFHPFCLDIIDRVIDPGQGTPAPILVRFVAVVVTSYAVAWVLKKYFEDPLIAVGRRLTGNKPAPGTQEPDPVDVAESRPASGEQPPR